MTWFKTVAMTVAISAGFLHSADAPAEEAAAKTQSRGGAVAEQGGRGAWQATGMHGAVAAGGEAAVNAGLEVLKAGGNAADAAIATVLAQTVTDSSMFCFGGEIPFLVYDAKRRVVEVICGQGAAPLLATREYFAAKGGIPGSGVEAATVPAVLDACLTVLDRYGTRTFAQSAAPVLVLLDRGRQPWHADLARTVRTLIAAEEQSPGDRSRGLRLVADCFYRGSIAHELDDWSRDSGGLIRYTDLATHCTRIEEPVKIEYHGHTVYKCGAWTQGPYLLQTLRMLEDFDFAKSGHNSPATIHTTLEAMKLALADRDVFYADPDFADVPLTELLSKEYAQMRRPLIDANRASLEQRPGDPRGGKPLLASADARRGLAGVANDTTTCVVADGSGNIIACTPSGWSGVVAGKTGVWLGSRLQSFNAWPGHPNCIEPGKRPRITLTPTLVLREGKPVLAVSVAGGDGQDQTALQMVLNHIEFGLSPADSVTAPRFGTNHLLGSFGQSPPSLGSLLINSAVGPETMSRLSALGHQVQARDSSLWTPCVIRIDPGAGRIDAAGDPRSGRHAAAF